MAGLMLRTPAGLGLRGTKPRGAPRCAEPRFTRLRAVAELAESDAAVDAVELAEPVPAVVEAPVELEVPFLPTVGDEVSPIMPPEPVMEAVSVPDEAVSVPDMVQDAMDALPKTTYNLTRKLSVDSYPGVGAPLKSGPTPKADAPLELQLPDLPDFSNAGDALNKAAAGAQEAASQLTGNITGAFSNLANSMTGGVSGLQGSVNGGLSGIKGSVTGGISGIQGSVTEGISGITGVVSSSTNGATRQLTDAVSGTTAGVAALVDENTQAVRDVLNAATASAAGAVGSALQSVAGAADQAISTLPPEARDVLQAAGKGVAAAASFAVENPAAAGVLTGAVAVPVVSAWYKDRFAGFAGEISAEQVRTLLVDGKKNVVLVDIREEVERQAAGIPELKQAARYKAATLPLSFADPLLPPTIVRQAANREQLRLAVAAALISGLKQVKSSLDSVVIMDSRGDRLAKELARALRTEGVYSAYIMKGGFNGWVKGGLPVEQGTEYEASPVALIKDEIEILSQKVNEIVSQVNKPEVGVPLLGTGALLAIAAVNYHITLQVIGLWGTAISIYNGSAVAVLKSIAAGATSAASSAGALAAKASAPKPTSKAASRAASRPAAQQPMAVAAAAVDPVPAPPAEVEEPTTAFAEQEEVVVAVPAVKEVKEAQQLSS